MSSRGVLGVQVGDECGPRLADAIDAVLGLPVVAWRPVEIVKDHVRRGGERDPRARRVKVPTSTRTDELVCSAAAAEAVAEAVARRLLEVSAPDDWISTASTISTSVTINVHSGVFPV